MDAYDAANKAFNKCKSRNPSKNRACAPYLAKMYLKSAGVKGEDLDVAVEYANRLLDEWYTEGAIDERIPGKVYPVLRNVVTRVET